MTYDQLVGLIFSYVKSGEYEQVIPSWIALGEAVMNRELKDFRQVARAQQVVSTPRIELPADFGGTISITTANRTHLQWVTPSQMAESKQFGCLTGQPTTYTVVGGEFEFGPEPSAACTMTLSYWQLIGPLTSANQTNWLLDSHPDLYLYGALMQAPLPQAAEWATKFAEAVISAKRVRNNQGAWLRVGNSYVP